MKKSGKIILLLALAIFMSCNKDTIDEPIESNISQNLIGITESIYANSNGGSVNNYMITSGENVKTFFNSESYYEMNTFVNNRIDVSIFYDSNEAPINKTSYTYNGNGKLLTIIYQSYTDNSTYVMTNKTEFVHNGNEILSTETFYNIDGSVDFVRLPNVFTLNASNEIIKFEDFNFGGSWVATYSGGNLASIVVNGYGNKDGTGNFNYTDGIASDAYHKDVFRFGAQYKLNMMLASQVGGYSFKQLAELGKNYLSGYMYLNDDGSEQVTLSALYEFDSNERLIKQSKNKMFFGSLNTTVLTYQYQ